MTYQQFDSILSTEKLPSEQDLLEAFRYIIPLWDHLIFQNMAKFTVIDNSIWFLDNLILPQVEEFHTMIF